MSPRRSALGYAHAISALPASSSEAKPHGFPATFRRRIAKLSVRSWMTSEPGLDAFSEVEVHNWEFGGRR
jgi:hypothetical protein